MHIECMVMHDVQNESLVFFYQLGLLSPLPSGENKVSQTPHCAAKLLDLPPGIIPGLEDHLPESPLEFLSSFDALPSEN